jgi:GNAT superfamily N-acetyltransferase
MKIRTGGPDDIPATITLLDRAIAWLTARGYPDQWGTRPWSSRPSAVERTNRYAHDYLLRAAEDDEGRVTGVCVLAEELPEYVPPAGEPELYIRLLVTDRARSGTGIGAALVADAVEETRRRGISLLRVDCYAGNDGLLIAQYEALGFTRAEEFTVDNQGTPWHGQVLQLRV